MRQKALRSFPNRYLFSLYHKVTSSLSIRYILRIILHRVLYLVDYKKFINLDDVLSRCVLSVSPCRPANSSFHLFYWQGSGNLSGQLFGNSCVFPAISFLVFRKCMCVCSLIFGPRIENGSFSRSLSIFSAHSPDKIPCKSETFVIFA